MIGGHLEGVVLADQELAALVWEGLGPAMRAAVANLSPEVQEQLRPYLVGLQRAHREQSASGSGSAERRIGGAVVQSSHELPATEAAAMIGVSRRRVGQMCEAGRLEGRKVAGRLLVSEASVLAEIDRRENGAA